LLEGLYSAAAGMAAQQRRMEALSNDVANVNTNGYRRVRLGFRDLVYQQAGGGAGAGVRTGSGSAAEIVGRSQQQGVLRQTGNPFDLAIDGPGFFQVRRADGTLALTRDGSFRLDQNGRLVTSQGQLVEPGLTVPRGVRKEQVTVAADGRVTADGRVIGRIGIYNVAAPERMLAAGDSLFVPTADSGPVREVRNSGVVQGHLEASNVDLADAMVDMMDAQRSFTLASRAIHMQDEMMGIANGVKR
jgi:flagellar basal-body rod protein FlgG